MPAAVLCRCGSDETPYLDNFCTYYMGLGFDHIYFINTSSGDGHFFETLRPEIRKRITVIHYSSNLPGWQTASLNSALAYITHEWVLNVDMDEYLVLPCSTIHEFENVHLRRAGNVTFRWINVYHKDYETEGKPDPLEIFAARSLQYKSMTKIEKILDMGVHNSRLKKDCSTLNCSLESNGAFILHFAVRGIFDLLIRTIGRNYGNDKSGDIEEERLRTFLFNRTTPEIHFPFRFLLLRLSLAFPESGYYPFLPLALPKSRAIAEIFKAKLSSIGIVHSGESLTDLAQSFEERFALKQRLFKYLPSSCFSDSHFEKRVSYVNITREYRDILNTST